MIHKATSKFWKRYDLLPKYIQQVADKNLIYYWRILFTPRFKEIKHGSGLWSVCAGEACRAVAILEDGIYNWFWIGSHAEYDRLIS